MLAAPLVVVVGFAGCGAANLTSAVAPLVTTASSSTQAVSTPSRTATVTGVAAIATHQTTPTLTDAATANASTAQTTAAMTAGTALTGQAVTHAKAGSSAASVTVSAYFTAGNRLVTEARQVPSAELLQASLAALLAGPQATGHYTQVPVGTRLLGVQLAGTHATINLSSQAAALEGSPAIPLFLAQLVDTATQFPTVQQVTLQIDGRPVTALGGEGIAVPEPLDRPAVQRMLARS